MSRSRTIWLFRDERPDDPYLRIFESAGFKARCIPVLEPQITHDIADLTDSVSAVAVTSQRSIDALRANESLLQNLRRDVFEVPWYCVGEATRRAALSLGACVTTHAPGTARALARVLIEERKTSVLHLTGRSHRPELSDALQAAGIRVVTQIVYEMAEREPTEILSLNHADWAAFFSPRGVQIAHDFSDFDWSSIWKAAIGPTTASTMIQVGWAPDAIATRPTPTHLFESLLSTPTT